MNFHCSSKFSFCSRGKNQNKLVFVLWN